MNSHSTYKTKENLGFCLEDRNLKVDGKLLLVNPIAESLGKHRI